jgi:hypothetical protein
MNESGQTMKQLLEESATITHGYMINKLISITDDLNDD